MNLKYWILIIIFSLGLGEWSTSRAYGAMYPIPFLPSAAGSKFVMGPKTQNFPNLIRGNQRSLNMNSTSIGAFIPPAGDLCAPHIAQVENNHGIPQRLLRAISLIESGRTQGGKKVAWPWTINAEGKGYYFPTKAEAIAAVQSLQAKGVKSIDVGCMQVNLMHHKTAFKDLHAAFDPAKNVAYAAQYLRNLKGSAPSWFKAVGDYHSATPAHHIPYRQMVLKQWQKEGGTGGNALIGSEPTAKLQLAKATPLRPQAQLASLNKSKIHKIGRGPLKMGSGKLYTLRMPGQQRSSGPARSPFGHGGGIRLIKGM
jgi:hypothetical protein